MERNVILVYLESHEKQITRASLEAIAAAHQLAAVTGGRIVAALIGDISNAERATEYGVDEVLTIGCNEYQPEEYAAALVSVFERYGAAYLIIGATQDGKDLAGRVAARIGAGYIADAKAVTDGGSFVRAIYGGSIMETVSVAAPAVISVRAGSFGVPAHETAHCTPVAVEGIEPSQLRLRIGEVVNELADDIDLDDAEVIVSGGRGMGSEQNFKMLYELADVLDGAVGASRPAIEEGWISRGHQIGQSGKIVSPKLYIACGISGATQHVSGIIDSGFIVAVNKDPDAPIFNVADIGIVGDVAEVLPAMIAEFKSRKA